MTQNKMELRVYIACLASYNNGILHGEWVEADRGADHLRDAVNEILASSPIEGAEEFAIHDHEGFGDTVEEYTGLDQVAELAAFIEEHEALGLAVLDHFSGDLDESRRALEDGYHGTFASLAEYAEQITEGTTAELPPHLAPYIDYAAMGRDFELGGDVFTIQPRFDEVHVFAGTY